MDRWEPLLRGDIGKMAMMVTLLSDGREEKELVQAVRRRGYLIVTGKVGSMDPQKVVGSIESSVKRQALIDLRSVPRRARAVPRHDGGAPRNQPGADFVRQRIAHRRVALHGVKRAEVSQCQGRKGLDCRRDVRNHRGSG